MPLWRGCDSSRPFFFSMLCAYMVLQERKKEKKEWARVPPAHKTHWGDSSTMKKTEERVHLERRKRSEDKEKPKKGGCTERRPEIGAPAKSPLFLVFFPCARVQSLAFLSSVAIPGQEATAARLCRRLTIARKKKIKIDEQSAFSRFWVFFSFFLIFHFLWAVTSRARGRALRGVR